MAQVLLTGGAGFIGAHTAVQLIEAGFKVVILDNFSTSSPTVIDRIESITAVRPVLYNLDVRDRQGLARLFIEQDISAVIHFAALKVAPASVSEALSYYDNNVGGALALVDAMNKYGCKQFVFSSTANVYGDYAASPVCEDTPLDPSNPYGKSKLMVEQMLADIHLAHPDLSIAILRYFNPVGAHSSGLIGEDPCGTPTNLMPYIAKVAAGQLPYLNIYGNDYATHDGTGVRDFIHVVDLADAHIAALKFINQHQGIHTWNVGTGKGYSVLDMVHAFEKASECQVPYQIVPRRAKDIPVSYAEVTKSSVELGWRTARGIEEMCADLWLWQKKNPNGYDG